MKLGQNKSMKAQMVESACGICASNTHLAQDCPTITMSQVQEQANATNATNAFNWHFNPPRNETYDPYWRNHPNFSWKNDPSQNNPLVPTTSVPLVPS